MYLRLQKAIYYSITGYLQCLHNPFCQYLNARNDNGSSEWTKQQNKVYKHPFNLAL